MSTIRMITMHGNSSTNPSGIEIEELPFNLMRRRKKANRRPNTPFSRTAVSSTDGKAGALGRRLVMRWIRFMAAMIALYQGGSRAVQTDVVSRKERTSKDRLKKYLVVELRHRIMPTLARLILRNLNSVRHKKIECDPRRSNERLEDDEPPVPGCPCVRLLVDRRTGSAKTAAGKANDTMPATARTSEPRVESKW